MVNTGPNTNGSQFLITLIDGLKTWTDQKSRASSSIPIPLLKPSSESVGLGAMDDLGIGFGLVRGWTQLKLLEHKLIGQTAGSEHCEVIFDSLRHLAGCKWLYLMLDPSFLVWDKSCPEAVNEPQSFKCYGHRGQAPSWKDLYEFSVWAEAAKVLTTLDSKITQQTRELDKGFWFAMIGPGQCRFV